MTVADAHEAPVDAPDGMTAEARQIMDSLFYEGSRRIPYLARFTWLMVFSAAIATFGMLSNSAAVVIGAMLVAPLMTPILATGGALVRAEPARVYQSLAVLALGMATAVVVAWIVSAVSSLDLTNASTIPSEILARTEPDLLDLGVAIAAGAAGGYVLVRPEAGSALPGVGIAVALVPPLAATGILFQAGQGSLARSAFLLFLTNLAAITLSASLVFLLSNFVPWATIQRAWRRVGVGLVVVVLMLAAVAVPLTFHTLSVLEDREFQNDVSAAIREWDDTVRVVGLTADVVDGVGIVEVDVAGPNAVLPAWELATLIRDRHGGDVDLTLSHEQVELFQVNTR